MDRPVTEAVLLRALGDLSRQHTETQHQHKQEILDQIAGVNRRLDRVNGRLDKHDDALRNHVERIAALEPREASAAGVEKPILSVPSTPRGLIGGVVAAIFSIALAIYEGMKFLKDLAK